MNKEDFVTFVTEQADAEFGCGTWKMLSLDSTFDACRIVVGDRVFMVSYGKDWKGETRWLWSEVLASGECETFKTVRVRK